MVDGHLLLTNRLTVLHRSQGRKLLKWEQVSIRAQDTDAVLLKKFAHGLSRQPGGSKYSSGGTIGEHQPCIAPTDQVDAAGQLVQDALQQGPPGFRLDMHPLFDEPP